MTEANNWRERLWHYCEFHSTTWASHILEHEGNVTYLCTYCSKGGFRFPEGTTAADIKPLKEYK